MPIKVVHAVRQYHPSVGGMEDVVKNIAQHQKNHHDHLPVVVTLDRLFRNSGEVLARSDVVDGVPVVRLPYRGSSRYPLCPRVLKYVRDADVIHVHGIDFFFDFLAATRPLHRRPMLASTHGGFFHTRFASTLKQVYFRTATRFSSAAYDRVVATSENDGEIFSAIVRPPKRLVIENGANVEKYADRAARGLTPTLIYFGRWSVNKGLVETLDFFEALWRRRPEWRLIIAGREYDHTLEELNARIAAAGLGDAVRLVAQPSDAALAELMEQSSYFVCQSRHEGFGLAPIEAMSAGLTPVLSDIPPFRRLVEASRLGLLLERSSIEHQVDALLALHARGDAAYLDRRMAAQRFVERYSWRHVADRYVDLYRTLHARVSGEAR